MTPETGEWLLQLARDSIAAGLDGASLEVPHRPVDAEAPGACFVTLERHGALRGCIGTLQAHQPLWRDVMHNARAAALEDPRFPPLDTAELADTFISLSLLGPAEPLEPADRESLKQQLSPGKHGLIISAEGKKATFLPAVWEQLPDADAFIDQLKAKAGLPAGFPDERMTCQRYTVEKLTENPSRRRR